MGVTFRDLHPAFAAEISGIDCTAPLSADEIAAVEAGMDQYAVLVFRDQRLTDLQLRDRTLKVLHRPGHSPSDTVFLDDRTEQGEGSILLGADHLIKHISSNPLLARPLGDEADPVGERPRALLTYIDSLQQTRAMELSLVLPGHGPPIVGHAELIDQRMRMHERRAAKILRLIEAQPRTAHEIAHELWGNVAVMQAYLTLSEVLGHVDLLLADGSVVEVECDGVVRFATP